MAVANNGAPTDVGGGYIDAVPALASVVPLSAAPTGVHATNGDSQSALQWTAPPQNPNFPTTSYVITPVKDAVPQPPVSTPTNDTIRRPGSDQRKHVHVYRRRRERIQSRARIRAINAIDLGVPDAPTSVLAVPGNGEAEVSWTAPPASDLTITGYEVTPFIGAAAQPTQSFSDPGDHADDHGFDQRHRLFVQGCGDRLVHDRSAVSGQRCRHRRRTSGARRAAHDLHRSRCVDHLGAPASDNGSPVTGYNVRVQGTGGSVHPFSANTTEWTATGLSNGSSLAPFAVSAVNATGTGPARPKRERYSRYPDLACPAQADHFREPLGDADLASSGVGSGPDQWLRPHGV